MINSLFKNGSVIAVWINAKTRQEALENYWSFWNHGATNAEDLHWTSNTEGYFWTTDEKLKRYFKNSSRAIVLNELGEDWQGDEKTGPEVSERIKRIAFGRWNLLNQTEGPSPYNRRVMLSDYSVSDDLTNAGKCAIL